MSVLGETLSREIGQLIEELNALGFKTTDSGDGSNHAAGMECALPFRHVFGVLSDEQSRDLVKSAHQLKDLYPEAHVEVNYEPGCVAIFAIYPDGKQWQ